MILREWDFDNRTVTTWLRLGDCNRCGECCRAEIHLRVVPETVDDPRQGGELGRFGVWHEWNNGQPRFWQVLSIELDKLDPPCCDEHDLCPWRDEPEGYAGICQAWPLHPDHVAEFNNCSYSFVKLTVGKIDPESEGDCPCLPAEDTVN